MILKHAAEAPSLYTLASVLRQNFSMATINQVIIMQIMLHRLIKRIVVVKHEALKDIRSESK